MDEFIKIRYNMRAVTPKEQAKHNGWTWDEALLNIEHISSINIEECHICMSNGGGYSNVLNEDINWIVDILNWSYFSYN